jgi:hypothetical protein
MPVWSREESNRNAGYHWFATPTEQLEVIPHVFHYLAGVNVRSVGYAASIPRNL